MKYNPKVNEKIVRIPGFAESHPLQDESQVQGSLEIIHSLQEELKEITGMDEVTLQPAAGAHGEWTALMIFKAFHEKNGEGHRNEVIVPDSAHGTNPASAAFAGFKAVTVKSNERGEVDIEDLKRLVNENTAAIMLTNPNTLGIFEQNIMDIRNIVHEAGGLLYYDGANLNAIMDKVRPGDMGFDAVHLNLHKTFTGPHGGGGPGSGPVGVKKNLQVSYQNQWSLKKMMCINMIMISKIQSDALNHFMVTSVFIYALTHTLELWVIKDLKKFQKQQY